MTLTTAAPRHVLADRALTRRCLALAVIFGLAAALLAVIDHTPPAQAARWPSDTAVFEVANWTVGPQSLEVANGVHFVTREYLSAGGPASLSMATATEAKRVFRAGAAVPFMGSGYTVDQAPPSLVLAAENRSAVVVRRERELGLLLYAYGERRGLVGNGIPGWALVALDGLLAHPNDYYLVRVYAPLGELNPARAQAVAQLADTVFPRLAAWYAAD